MEWLWGPSAEHSLLGPCSGAVVGPALRLELLGLTARSPLRGNAQMLLSDSQLFERRLSFYLHFFSYR